METVVGIFQSNTSGERAVDQLRAAGIADDGLTLLRPGTPQAQIESSIPTSDTESAGMGEALGGAVGGAIGAGGGATLGLAVASLLIPGVGPVLVAGALGAALLGAGGAMAGSQAGHALEDTLGNGVPHDELFIYEDALRHGHTVLIVNAPDDEVADRARKVLKQAGAETVDAARENWWLGIKDAEQLEYEGAGGSFKHDEASYRRGFETALHARLRGRRFDEVANELRERHQGTFAERPFRAGYERGQAYLRAQGAKSKGQSAKG